MRCVSDFGFWAALDWEWLIEINGEKGGFWSLFLLVILLIFGEFWVFGFKGFFSV